jgi:hypothetical protein
MFAFCGKRFRVYKRAHKTCDTVLPSGDAASAGPFISKRGCDGSAHGGCQAGCLIFWKEAWLKPVSQDSAAKLVSLETQANHGPASGCTQAAVWASAQTSDPQDRAPRYVCQATQLSYATTDLSWWDIRQYIEDYVSGNVTLGQLLKGLIYSGYCSTGESVGCGADRVFRVPLEKSPRVSQHRLSP